MEATTGAVGRINQQWTRHVPARDAALALEQYCPPLVAVRGERELNGSVRAHRRRLQRPRMEVEGELEEKTWQPTAEGEPDSRTGARCTSSATVT